MGSASDARGDQKDWPEGAGRARGEGAKGATSELQPAVAANASGQSRDRLVLPANELRAPFGGGHLRWELGTAKRCFSFPEEGATSRR